MASAHQLTATIKQPIVQASVNPGPRANVPAASLIRPAELTG